MRKKWWMLVMVFGIGFHADAAFVSHTAVKSETAAAAPAEKKTMAQWMEEAMGRHLNWMEKMQVKRMEKRLAKGKPPGLFSQREQLTEGFRPLPFFGSLLTGGLVYIIMLFTAEDSNSLQWAGWGFLIVWLAFLAIRVVNLVSL
jgi:hypothetical protein